MSKENIETTFHYGTEDFRKLFIRVTKAKLMNQKLLIKKIEEEFDRKDTIQLPFTKE